MKPLLYILFICLLVNNYKAQTSLNSISILNISFLFNQMEGNNLTKIDVKSEMKIENDLNQENLSKTELFENEIIEDWLIANPNVRIIKQSEYSKLSSEERKIYLEKKYLILKGEDLKIEDIYNY